MKHKVLALLRSQSKQLISGEEISSHLGVSRTAIWKHIKSLREEGYQIDSQPGAGYLLTGVPDLLLPEEFLEQFSGSIFTQNIEHHRTLASTNTRAKALADEGAPEGTLVIAENQTAGRGRLGRNWFSPDGGAGGIYASIVLRPPLRPEQASGLTLLAAVALAQGVRQVTGLKAGIKWPNDLLLEGRKFCGILTEMKGELDRVHYLAIGTGINVNTEIHLFPPELQETATSLQGVLGRKVSRIELLVAYLAALEKLYDIYLEYGLPPILRAWKEWNITLGQYLDVISGDKLYSGRAVDIDKTGALIIQSPDGKQKIFHSGEVTLKKT